MASESLKRKVARRIAAAERIIQNNRNRETIESAEEEIINLTSKYNLSLEDMMDIDDMVQNILKK
jgi:cell division GTPase FtsZ